MAKSGNTAAVVILSIIAIAGLGLGGYTFVNEQFLGGDEHTHDFTDTDTGLIPVALWNSLDENYDTLGHGTTTNYLIEYGTNITLNTNYVNIINETRFTLPAKGLYKISLNALLSGFVVDSVYWVSIIQNSTALHYFDRFETDNPLISGFYFVSSSVYINSTGGNDTYYEIHVTSSPGGSIIPPSTTFNQLAIEYYLI